MELTGALRVAMQDLLLNKMIRKVGSPGDRWKALVVDRAALRILASALRVNELVNDGISIVEFLEMRREPLPKVPAIYFVTPTAENVQQLVQESKTQYKAFHLFFTGRLPDFLMDVMREKASFLRRVQSLVELNVELLALESRVFSLDRPGASLPQIFSGSEQETREEIATVAQRLAETCSLVAKTVEWQVRNDVMSSSCRAIASVVKEQFETNRLAANRDTEGNAVQPPPTEPDADCEATSSRLKAPTKATLLILDRVSDLATPLVHEYTYQAMAHDLLDLNYRKPGGAHIEVEDEKTEKKKFIQLEEEEKDPIWTEIRWEFIQDALKQAQDAFRDFVETDAAFKLRGKEASELDIKEMGAAVRALPDSQNRADKHAMHIKAIRDCLEISSQNGLTDLALVEQDLVTGKASDGQKLKSDIIIETIIDMLGNEDVPAPHRIRLLMIALIVSEGLNGLGGEASALSMSATFRAKLRRYDLENVTGLDSELESAITGLRELLTAAKEGFLSFQEKHDPKAVAIEGDDSVSGKFKKKYAARQARKHHKKETVARQKRHGLESDGNVHYDVARYHPPLRSVLMDLVDDALEETLFPTTSAFKLDNLLTPLGDSTASSNSREGSSQEHSQSASTSNRGRSKTASALMKSFGYGESSQTEPGENPPCLADPEHLFVVFIVGGICYSEVRAVYEVCAKRQANILIGGSQMLRPKTFIQALAAVADPVIRIQVMLPPLPLELVQTRAAQAAREAAAAAAAAEEKANAGTVASSRDSDASQKDGEAEVEVITSYKKSRLRFFRKK